MGRSSDQTIIFGSYSACSVSGGEYFGFRDLGVYLSFFDRSLL